MQVALSLELELLPRTNEAAMRVWLAAIKIDPIWWMATAIDELVP